MRLMRRLRPGQPAGLAGCAATIGVFDGVHLGHQRILGRVRDAARRLSLPSLVFTFEPTPAEVLPGRSPPARLTRFREKFEVLAGLGMDLVYCPPFEPAIEHLDPAAFIDKILVGTLGVRHLVIGDDFRFARGRSGTVEHLRAAAPGAGYALEQVGSVVEDGLRVSSTAIRAAIREGDLALARRLLGRYYRMSGRVVDGRRLGRQLGFPTANVRLGRRVSPLSGIFAVKVGGIAAGPLDGVASVGTRPTVDGVEPLLEVHVFDFSREIYGAHIHVDFVAKLRDEVKFPDLASLREQMERDAAGARRILRDLAH